MHDDRLFKCLLGEKTLVLRLQVAAPVYRELERIVVLFENRDRLGIRDALECACCNAFQRGDQAVFDPFVEERKVGGVLFKRFPDEKPDEFLGEVHVAGQAAEGHFRLDHPELGQMARRIGIFRPERGAEGVHLAKRERVDFSFELPGHRQARAFSEKVVL